MNLASINSTVPAETMIGTVLILLAVVVRGIRSSLKRLSQSRLTLQTESFVLDLQTPQHSSQLESQLHDQQGDDEHGRCNDDDGRIPSANQRLKW